MKRSILISLITILILSVFVSAQSNSGRQMVMDDGYTFFIAKPVKGRNAKNSGDIDIGWRLQPSLRLMGTFPDNSGFRIVVRKNAKQLSKFFCTAYVYRRGDDRNLNARRNYGEVPFDDFIQLNRCSNENKPIKPTGMMDVEVYYVDGDTDEEKLVRKHRIDVRKMPWIKGFKGATYRGVSEYVVQRHAEAAVGIIHIANGRGSNYINGSSLSSKPFNTDVRSTGTNGKLMLYLSISPGKKKSMNGYIRCSVNGQRIKLVDDKFKPRWVNRSYFYDSALAYRQTPKFQERVVFTYMIGALPLLTGERDVGTKIEDHPGKWECSVLEDGEVIRKIRFEVGSDGKIVPHPEQQSGNVNLYYNAFLVDVEIPKGGASIDERLMPQQEAGFFYGIPWTTRTGKAAAAGVSKKGKPYPVLPK
ncbi:MAG: hypothetical protein HKN25_03230 [Pyrinomonadaceae bacterium]|nr:hypothetical protein [Pyrinomonadaceae bacterium]